MFFTCVQFNNQSLPQPTWDLRQAQMGRERFELMVWIVSMLVSLYGNMLLLGTPPNLLVTYPSCLQIMTCQSWKMFEELLLKRGVFLFCIFFFSFSLLKSLNLHKKLASHTQTWFNFSSCNHFSSFNSDEYAHVFVGFYVFCGGCIPVL